MTTKFLKAILLAILVISLIMPANIVHADPFSDELDGIMHEWIVSRWIAYGLLVGYPDGKYLPTEPSKYTETMTLINRVLGFEKKADAGYRFLEMNRWYSDEVLIAKNNYMDWYGGNTFNSLLATRIDIFSAMVCEALGLEVNDQLESIGNVNDLSSFKKKYLKYMDVMVEHNYIDIEPESNTIGMKILTRNEVIAILDRVIGDYQYEPCFVEDVTIRSNYTINCPGVELKNVVLEGDLLIGAGVDENDFKLNNVVVKGNIILLNKKAKVILAKGSNGLLVGPIVNIVQSSDVSDEKQIVSTLNGMVLDDCLTNLPSSTTLLEIADGLSVSDGATFTFLDCNHNIITDLSTFVTADIQIKVIAENKSTKVYNLEVNTGEKRHVYHVYTPNQLNDISNYLSYDIILESNIDASTIEGFIPIGVDCNHPFTGNFDGNGYEISNLFITVESDSSLAAGLFGYIKGSTIKNIGIVNSTISGNKNVAGLVGHSQEGIISDSYFIGNVIGHDNVAGIVASGDETTIANCYSAGNISGQYNVGGIAGTILASISDCTSYSYIAGEYNLAGIAINYHAIGGINNCFAKNAGITAFDNSHRITLNNQGNLNNNYASDLLAVNDLSLCASNKCEGESISSAQSSLASNYILNAFPSVVGENRKIALSANRRNNFTIYYALTKNSEYLSIEALKKMGESNEIRFGIVHADTITNITELELVDYYLHLYVLDNAGQVALYFPLANQINTWQIEDAAMVHSSNQTSYSILINNGYENQAYDLVIDDENDSISAVLSSGNIGHTSNELYKTQDVNLSSLDDGIVTYSLQLHGYYSKAMSSFAIEGNKDTIGNGFTQLFYTVGTNNGELALTMTPLDVGSVYYTVLLHDSIKPTVSQIISGNIEGFVSLGCGPSFTKLSINGLANDLFDLYAVTVDEYNNPSTINSLLGMRPYYDSDNDGLSDIDETNNYKTDPLLSDSDYDGLSDGNEVSIYSTNPINQDTDGDGLTDGKEVNDYSTNPINQDTDRDGLTDGEEVNDYSTDPINQDTDEDELTDGEEVNDHNTDPNNADTDGDGLKDGEELFYYHTDPLLADTDGDGLVDVDELYHFNTDPLLADTDDDGLSDGDEVYYKTNPNEADTDGDGPNDGNEINIFDTDPLIADNDTDSDGLPDSYEDKIKTNPLKSDSDLDGLTDKEEVIIYGTKPLLKDTDHDLLNDGDEVKIYQSDPLLFDTDGDLICDGHEVNTYGTSPILADTDSDGLKDKAEISYYDTNPLLIDTDGDGVNDGDEISNGTDPSDPAD